MLQSKSSKILVKTSLTFSSRKHRSGLKIFDYDPLTLDFPALCLHCLPPPPTLHSSTPIPNPNCWDISPPGDEQYEAVRSHFSTIFRNYRNTLAITSTEPMDDLSYPPPPNYLSPEDDLAAQAIRAEHEAVELESKIGGHIHQVFAAWNSLSGLRRTEIWTLELARSVGRKSIEIQKLKQDKAYEQQNVAHLKIQNNELSRLQQPREFRLVPPKTIPLSQEAINSLGEMAAGSGLKNSVGYTIHDRSENLDIIIERAIGRWKDVIRDARGDSKGGGLSNQRSLSDGSTMLLSPVDTEQNININNNNNHNNNTSQLVQSNNSGPRPITVPTRHNPPPNQNPTAMNHNHSTSMPMSNGLESIGSDADADADMEEDDSYAELNDLSDITNQGYRLPNGTAGKNGGGGMEGIINESRGHGGGGGSIAFGVRNGS